MKHINIEQFSNGELTQQINRELEAVARNIADPNTYAKAARKITVTITMKANEKRDFVTTGITTKSTLAPTLGAVTALCIGKDIKTGDVEVAEIGGNQIPGQMTVNDVIPQDRPFDPDTGEILENASAPVSNVVDLRRKA